MKFNHGLKREKLVAVTLCFGVALYMSFQVGRTDPFIATMLGIITIGVYLIVLSGQWRSKNTYKLLKRTQTAGCARSSLL